MTAQSPSDQPTMSWHSDAGTAGARGESVPQIEGYEILGRLGEGGMGIVWKAVQLSTRREVALKFLAAGAFATDKDRHRFEREVELAAALEHPNIARVYDSGLTHGGYYYAMQLVPGVPLDAYVESTRPTQREILSLMRTVCLAVQHAHQRGVIHRDLKPSNVLVTRDGVPYVLDFGLAKSLVSERGDRSVSTEGSVAGTPAYMSPEQAQGRHRAIDVRTDVYSLGAILYRLLTGRTPHGSAGSHYEVLRRVVQEEVKRPHEVSRMIGQDVEALTLKALAKDPEKRYATAGEFAADIENYLKGDPIAARSHTAAYYLMNRARKHWGKVSIAAVFVGLAVYSYVRIAHELGRAVKAETQAESALTASVASEKKAREEAEAARRSLYFNRITVAEAEFRQTNVAKAREVLDLCPKDMRCWEWHYLRRICDQSVLTMRNHTDKVFSVAFSPNASRIASGSRDGTFRVWDAATGAEVMAVPSLATSVAFSRDGQRIATTIYGSSGVLIIREAATGKEMMTLRCGNWFPRAVFSPDGGSIVWGSEANAVKVWETDTGHEVAVLRGHENWVEAAAFSPDGKRIVTAGRDRTVKIWDTASGVELKTLVGHRGELQAVAFSPNGSRIVSGGIDMTLKVWDSATGTELMTLRGHDGAIYAVAWHGERIASGSGDGTIRVWDAASGTELMTLRGHQKAVTSVDFTADGTRIVSGSNDTTVKVWDVNAGAEFRALWGHLYPVYATAFSPDSRRIAVEGAYGVGVRSFNADTGVTECVYPSDHVGQLRSLAFSPDGKRLAAGGEDKAVRVWDANRPAKAATYGAHQGEVVSVAFNPDGSRLYSGSLDGTIKVWDTSTGTEVSSFPCPLGHVYSIAFSADGKRFLSISSNGTIMLRQAATGEEVLTCGRVSDYRGPVYSAAFSPDGLWLVSPCDGNVIKVWNALTGAEIVTLRGHVDRVHSVAYSPDGRRIVSASEDTTVKIWDAATGTEIMTLRTVRSSNTRPVYAVAFSPDGRRIVAGGLPELRLWDSGPWDDNAPAAAPTAKE